MIAFSTERLDVCDWTPARSDPVTRHRLETALSSILTPPVLSHLPPSFALNKSGSISAWIDDRAAESLVLQVLRRDTGELVGLTILATPPDSSRSTVHLGYLLAEAAWGQGLATELVAGLVPALKNAGVERLVGGVDEANPASAQVLLRNGFTQDPGLSDRDSATYVRDLV